MHFKESWQGILVEVLKTSPLEILVLLLITLIYFLFDGLITYKMASKHSDNISFKDCLFCSFYCIFLGIATMGSASGIGEVHYFHNKGIDAPIAGGICIIKYVIKKLMVAFYGLLAFSLLYVLMPSLVIDYRLYLFLGTILAALIILFLFALLTWDQFSSGIFKFVKKIITHEKWTTKIIVFEKKIKTFQLESKNILKDTKSIFIICLLNLCKLSCLYLFPLFHFSSVITIEYYFIIVMIMAICNMLAGVIPTPYGLGSLEFVCIILFGQIIREPKIISMLLLLRFFTDVIPLMIGSFCFVHSKRKKEYLLHKINS